LISYHFNLVVHHKIITFKLSKDVGPFITKSRNAREVAGRMMAKLGFSKTPGSKYDPKGIMSKLRVENNIGAYEHQPEVMMDKITNLDIWEEVKEVLQKLGRRRSLDKGQDDGGEENYLMDIIDLYEEHPDI